MCLPQEDHDGDEIPASDTSLYIVRHRSLACGTGESGSVSGSENESGRSSGGHAYRAWDAGANASGLVWAGPTARLSIRGRRAGRCSCGTRLYGLLPDLHTPELLFLGFGRLKTRERGGSECSIDLWTKSALTLGIQREVNLDDLAVKPEYRRQVRLNDIARKAIHDDNLRISVTWTILHVHVCISEWLR